MRFGNLNRICNRGKHRCACRSRLTDCCLLLPRYSAKTQPHPRSRRTPIRGARYTTRVAVAHRDATSPPVISASHQSLVSAACVSRIYNMVRGRNRARASPEDDGERRALSHAKRLGASRSRHAVALSREGRRRGVSFFAASAETKPLPRVPPGRGAASVWEVIHNEGSR